MKNLRKKVLFVLLAIVMIGGTFGAYAYWDNLSQEDTNITIGVGQGVTLNVDLDEAIPANTYLIPAGAIQKPGDVYEIVLEYTVVLSTEVSTALNLSVVASNVAINGSTVNAGLVNVAINAPATINNVEQTVTVTITLSEPTTPAAYQAIANGSITFDLTFTAAQ